MSNMYVYKIGESYLKKSGIDKNSGIWELEKIRSIAEKYTPLCKKRGFSLTKIDVFYNIYVHTV